MKVCRNLEGFRGEGRERGRVLRIAHDTAVSTLRTIPDVADDLATGRAALGATVLTRHPSDDALRRWLEGGRDGGVGDHLDSCDACSDRGDAFSIVDARVPLASSEALPLNAGLETRLMERVHAAVSNRDAASTFLGLLGIGLQTAQVVLGEGTNS